MMMNRRRINRNHHTISNYLTIGLLLSFTFWGCSPNRVTETPNPNNQTAETVAEDTRTIHHAMGTTEITGTPQRVVVLTNEGTDMALALGVTPVGAVKSWQGEPYYDYIETELKDVPVVGDEFQPNLEQIVALKPDLIIGSKVRQEPVYDQLSAIAPTIFSETLGATWKDNLQLYAKALNKESEAQELLTDWDQRVTTLKDQLGENPPTVSLVRFLPGTARIYYQASFPGQIVAEVGLPRPPAQQKDKFAEEIGLENISNLEADHLFYFTYNEGDKKGEAVKNEWFSHPLWNNLDVVQNQQIYKVSDAEWTSSSGILAANQVLDDLSQHLLNQ